MSRVEKQMHLTSFQYISSDILIDQGHTDPWKSLFYPLLYCRDL